MQRTVVVVGGGLAGLTAALELRRHGQTVVLLEGSQRLGGKAGADRVGEQLIEHGYHIFPRWYVNTRRLLGELGVELNDLDSYFVLERGRFPQLRRIKIVDPFSDGALPLPERLLFSQAVVEFCSAGLHRDRFSHRISSTGFLASRPYALRSALRLNEENMLKAVAVPAAELSAWTAQQVGRSWMRSPAPFVSVLRADAETAWFKPFAARLAHMGVALRLGTQVRGLVVENGRLEAVRLGDGSVLRGDTFVLATPLEVTRTLVDDAVFQCDPRLARLHKLQAVPMASFHLYLRRKVAGLPREHVFFRGGRYALSFIDVSQHWSGCNGTVLSCISSNFQPLTSLSPNAQARELLSEIQAYLPIPAEDVERWHVSSNVDTPLFQNTPSSWHNRPEVRTRLGGLYLAGDYVQSPVDLATMEAAVFSGMQAATAILDDQKVAHAARPKAPPHLPGPLMKLIAAMSRPLSGPLWLWARSTQAAERRLRGEP